MKNKIKIDVSGDGWKTIEQANEQIDTLQKFIVSCRESGMDMDFSAVEEARKIRDKLFPANAIAQTSPTNTEKL